MSSRWLCVTRGTGVTDYYVDWLGLAQTKKAVSAEEKVLSNSQQWLECPCGAQDADVVLSRSLWKQDEEDLGNINGGQERRKKRASSPLCSQEKFFPFNTRLSRIEMQAFYAITSNVKIGNT